jgi:hypothetical protein
MREKEEETLFDFVKIDNQSINIYGLTVNPGVIHSSEKGFLSFLLQYPLGIVGNNTVYF